MNDQNYQETKINENLAICYNYLDSIAGLHFRIKKYAEPGEDQFIHKEIEEQEYQFNSLLRKTYYLVFVYIESKNNQEYLSYYKKEFEKYLETDYKSKIEHEYIDEIEEVIYFNKDLDKLVEFLVPYKSFDNSTKKTDC
ncbi:hypothetical protein LR002_01020 [Candidatus Gracilibacteria bacterium]|nr:hypothetical protein [Candidatus Gracilibacteria bacterium]